MGQQEETLALLLSRCISGGEVVQLNASSDARWNDPSRPEPYRPGRENKVDLAINLYGRTGQTSVIVLLDERVAPAFSQVIASLIYNQHGAEVATAGTQQQAPYQPPAPSTGAAQAVINPEPVPQPTMPVQRIPTPDRDTDLQFQADMAIAEQQAAAYDQQASYDAIMARNQQTVGPYNQQRGV